MHEFYHKCVKKKECVENMKRESLEHIMSYLMQLVLLAGIDGRRPPGGSSGWIILGTG